MHDDLIVLLLDDTKDIKADVRFLLENGTVAPQCKNLCNQRVKNARHILFRSTCTARKKVFRRTME